MPTPSPIWTQGDEARVSPARLRWIASATMTQLLNEHRAAERDLNLPGAEIVKAEYAAIEADLIALWTEIKRRRAQSAKLSLECAA